MEKELGMSSRKTSKLIPKLYSAETNILVKAGRNRYRRYKNLKIHNGQNYSVLGMNLQEKIF